MSDDLPYGPDTIVIPFTWSNGPPTRRLPYMRFPDRRRWRQQRSSAALTKQPSGHPGFDDNHIEGNSAQAPSSDAAEFRRAKPQGDAAWIVPIRDGGAASQGSFVRIGSTDGPGQVKLSDVLAEVRRQNSGKKLETFSPLVSGPGGLIGGAAGIRPSVGVGPFATPSGGVPLARPLGRASPEERQNELNGQRFGCHTCGTIEFGTPSGRPIIDHQPPQSLNPSPSDPAMGYPHCQQCSSRQGGLIGQALKRLLAR